MKNIKIPKDFFKGLKYKINFPKIMCKICYKKVLDTPRQRLVNL